jgi:hypothetical protein
MAHRWYPTVKAVTLYDVRDRPAINLEMESQIPSEVRHSFHNQATRRGTPLRNSANGNCAQKSKNQKNLADKTVSRLHGIYYAYNWFSASADAGNFQQSLKSPACSCVWMTLPASSQARITASGISHPRRHNFPSADHGLGQFRIRFVRYSANSLKRSWTENAENQTRQRRCEEWPCLLA